MNMSEIRDFLNSIEREIVNKMNMSKLRDFRNKIKGHEAADLSFHTHPN